MGVGGKWGGLEAEGVLKRNGEGKMGADGEADPWRLDEK